MKAMKAMKSWLSNESGNVESALVLIPLLLLVLSTLQIAMAVYSRQLGNNLVQSAVVQSGLYSANGSSPIAIMATLGITSAAGLNLDGGGTFYLGAIHHQIPSLTPLLPNGDSFTSVGASLGEGP